MQSCRCADDARDLHKMVDIHMLIIMYLIFMFNYHIHHACSVAMAHFFYVTLFKEQQKYVYSVLLNTVKDPVLKSIDINASKNDIQSVGMTW